MVVHGPQILTMFNNASRQVEKNSLTLQESLRSANESLTQAVEREFEIYNILAEQRADILNDKNFKGSLKESEKYSLKLLKQRDKELESHNKKLKTAYQKRDSLSDQIAKESIDLEKFALKVEEAETATLKELLKGKAYKDLLKNTKEAEDLYFTAENKIEVATADYTEKAVDYENDKTFMYLWNKGYDTKDYEANNIVHILDNWVARVIDYGSNMANYRVLSTLPKQLEEHLKDLEKTYTKLKAELTDIETTALKKDGVDKLQTELQKKQDSLIKLQEKLEKLDADNDALLEEINNFSINKDSSYLKAIQLLAENYDNQTLRILRDDAFRTQTNEDDLLVIELKDLRNQIDTQQRNISNYQQQIDSQTKADKNLSEALSQFNSKGYANFSSAFKDKNMINLLISNLATGALTSGLFMDRIRPLHYNPYNKIDDMFRRTNYSPRRGMNWGGNTRSRMGGGFSFPRGGGFGGSRSSGGFRTGGGF